ncbi:MAG: hypothetical protein IKG14_00795 [Clostridia bacterium]|nr:hypothetical protein [Clostridia bacterium]
MKEFIKKHNNSFFILSVFLLTIIKGWFTILTPYDNLWNFGNIFKLSTGKILYKDVNAVATPLFYQLGKTIYQLFSGNYIVFLLFGALLCTTMYFLIYLILKKIKLKKRLSLFYTILLIGITINTVPYSANYVILSFIFFELGVLLFLSNEKNNIVLHSIIIVLILLTYQKLAAGYFITFIIIQAFTNKEKSTAIKNIIKTTIISTCITLLLIAYYYLNGTLQYIYDLCIAGLSDFTNNTNFSFIFGNIIVILIPIGLLLWLIKNSKINKKTAMILLASAIGSNFIAIPIANDYHVRICSIFWSILLFYELSYLLKDILKMKKINNVITISNIIFIIVLFIKPIDIIDINNIYIQKEGIFKGSIVTRHMNESIKNVKNYLLQKQKEDKNIKILSISAMYYTLELNIDNWYFDMPLNGNLGKNGNQNLIEQIKNMPNNTIFLVENNERTAFKQYQYTTKVRDFVNSNYIKIDEIENFDVYEIKN